MVKNITDHINCSKLFEASWLKEGGETIKDKLYDKIQIIDYNEEDELVAEGELAKNTFILMNGFIRLTRKTNNEEKQIILFGAPGEVFGLSAALSSGSYPYSLIAHTNARVGLIRTDVLLNIMKDRPSVLLNLMGVVNNLINQLEKRRILVSSCSTALCIKNVLKDLEKKFGIDDIGFIQLPIKAKDLANYLGISRPHLYHLLSQFKDEFEYSSKYSRIRIKNSL